MAENKKLITHEMIMSNRNDYLQRGDVLDTLLQAFSTQHIENKLHKLDEHEVQALLNIIQLPAEPIDIVINVE